MGEETKLFEPSNNFLNHTDFLKINLDGLYNSDFLNFPKNYTSTTHRDEYVWKYSTGRNRYFLSNLIYFFRRHQQYSSNHFLKPAFESQTTNNTTYLPHIINKSSRYIPNEYSLKSNANFHSETTNRATYIPHLIPRPDIINNRGVYSPCIQSFNYKTTTQVNSLAVFFRKVF